MADFGLSSAIASRMKWYVYAYVDPDNDEIFYVGKGVYLRMLHGLRERGKGPLATRMRALRGANKKPRIEILAHGIRTQEMALRVEAALIDTVHPMANRIRGYQAVEFGRAPLDQVVALYDRRPAEIREPSILIRVNKLYSPQMSRSALYDATRGVWKINRQRAAKVKLAFAVFESVIREVYVVESWLGSGSTFLARNPRGEYMPGRSEFVGRVAPDGIRRRYLNRDVSRHFRRGDQNPIRYVNV